MIDYRKMIDNLYHDSILHTDDMAVAVLNLKKMMHSEPMPHNKIDEVYNTSNYPGFFFDDWGEQIIEGLVEERGEQGFSRMVAELSIVCDFIDRWKLGNILVH